MKDILYWITYPIRRFVSWARHRLGSCHAWCAHCITEADNVWYREHGYNSAHEYEKIVWLIGDPEPITWDEYCRKMQEKKLDNAPKV